MQFAKAQIYKLQKSLCNCSRASNLCCEKLHAVVQKNNILQTEVCNAIAQESNLSSEELDVIYTECKYVE